MPNDQSELSQKLQGCVETIVIVILENRSFDHVLGHLKYQFNLPVDGLANPSNIPKYANLYEGVSYYPAPAQDRWLLRDLPHDPEWVDLQLGTISPVTGLHTMRGFIQAYYKQYGSNLQDESPLNFLLADQVPVTSFLARSYAVCDRWFAPLPSSTQPNKLMAWTGQSRIRNSKGPYLALQKIDDTILDWAEKNDIPVRVYHAGVSFFLLLGKLKDVLFGPFRRFDGATLARDFAKEERFPQVVLIEPAYLDAAFLGSEPNDNHAPLPMQPGERFVQAIYEALTSNPARWAKTVLVVTYDEHGGFYDHVSPMSIPYEPPQGEFVGFKTTGVRVPALVVSPLVQPGSVCSAPMDHTSILQFLQERFPRASRFPQTVATRKEWGIHSVSAALDLDSGPRAGPPPIPPWPDADQPPLDEIPKPDSTIPEQFAQAAAQMVEKYRAKTASKHPEIVDWYDHRRV
jgi:phospholipase C